MAEYGYIGGGMWRGRLTGHVFDSEEAHDHYERLEAMKLRRPSKEQQELDKLPPEQLRALIEGLAGVAAEREGLTDSAVEVDVFQSRHPEYVKNVANGNQMAAYLKTRNMHAPYRCEDLEQAFAELSSAGTLELDQKAIAMKKRAEVEVRLSKQPQFDEEEAYNLPLQEIERRVRGTYIR